MLKATRDSLFSCVVSSWHRGSPGIATTNGDDPFTSFPPSPRLGPGGFRRGFVWGPQNERSCNIGARTSRVAAALEI